MAKKYLLAYMDYDTHSGLSSVSENLMERLMPYFKKQDIEVHIHALNYFGETKFKKIGGVDTLIYSAKSKAKNLNDPYYRDGFLKVLNDFDYDYVWVINDIAVISPTMGILKQIKAQKKKKFKSVLYCAIDSSPHPSHMNDFDFWDKVVVYTNYGLNELKYHFDKPEKTEVIPHGINTNHYYPIDDFDKHKTREKYGIPKNAFVFGNINKNNPRKNLGGTLIAFKGMLEMMEMNDEPISEFALYMHCSPTDPSGLNLIKASKNLGIDHLVFFPKKDSYKRGEGYTLEEMNEVYNCLDCFISTTGAEGWGLTITEAMAVNLPIIAPLNTAIKEITTNGQCIYPISKMTPHFEVHDGEYVRYLPDVEKTAEMMLNVYKQSKQFNNIYFGQNYASQIMKYNWDKIALQWQTLFSNL